MSTKKKLLFSLFTFLLFGLLLVLTEFVLEAASNGPDNPLVTEVRYDGIDWYQLNRSYLRKYFSSGDLFIPEFKPILFRKVKTPKTFRIVCLGESSMFGVPYQMTASVPGILRKQLRHLCPDYEFEVINFGASAINTNVIADFAPDLLRFQPDMVLIYTGHNEFYGPDGIGASWIEKQIPSLTSLKYSARNLRLMSFTRNFLRSAFRQNTPAPDFNLMRQVSRENQVDQSSDDAARVLKNFARNLQSIIQTFSGKGIPVIISDVTSNLLFPPFASLSQGDTAGIGTAVLLARQAASAADAQQIAHRLAPLLRSNPFHADLLYCRGMLELMQGNETAASGFLQSARDRDALAFRAPASINQVIHATARRTGIPCLPADSLFTAALPDLPSYSGLFWEHLHPTPKGYYDLAGRFLDEILNSGRLGIVSSLRPLPFDNDSLSLCWLDLAFGDISISNLTSKWPFRDYHVTPLVLNSEDEQLRAAVQEVYEQKAVWDAGCYKTAALFARQGRLREAQTTYDAVLEEYPYNFYAHYLLGSLLNQKGEHAAAFSHYAQSVSSNPRYPFALLDFGLLKVNMGRFDEAIGHFNSALAVIPSSEEPALRANIYYGLAAASANKKDFQTALADIDQALALKPTYNDALALRAQIQSFRQR